MSELRRFSRVPYRVQTEIHANGRMVSGETDNISLYGAFVRSIDRLPVNEEILLRIPSVGTADEEGLEVSGRVVRHTDQGFGVSFCQVGVDAFIQLKRIVSRTCGNERKVMNEFYSYLGHRDLVRF